MNFRNRMDPQRLIKAMYVANNEDVPKEAARMDKRSAGEHFAKQLSPPLRTARMSTTHVLKTCAAALGL